MGDLEYDIKDNELTVRLSGHIDSTNSAETEQKITAICEENPHNSLIIDCEKLTYISSAGLRVILKLSKNNSNTRLVNVSSEVYELFDMTGFTQILNIHKAFKTISVEGCEVIGRGANGLVYRTDPETVVKTFMDANALQDIERERELARTAFVLGIPTAISYDVVKIEGGGYGSVYELLKSTNFSTLLSKGEKTVDEVARISVDLLKIIHSKEVNPGRIPSMRERGIEWASFLKGFIPDDEYEKLNRLFSEIPEDNHMIHGDFHLKNIMYQDGEALLIDMDTICHGHPVFEFASIFNAYCGFSIVNHEEVKRFLGITHEQACELWEKILRLYFSDKNEAYVEQVRHKAMIIGFTRLIRRAIRRDGLNNDQGRVFIESAKRRLSELLPTTDSLIF